jgi:hypothetical protein
VEGGEQQAVWPVALAAATDAVDSDSELPAGLFTEPRRLRLFNFEQDVLKLASMSSRGKTLKEFISTAGCVAQRAAGGEGTQP